MLWQTWWFRALCLLAAAFVLLVLYRYRLHNLAKQLNLRFEERLTERTRIARDLHDSLLQGFVSASMQLHVAVDDLPANSTSKAPLTRVLQLMGRVIDEGRNTVRGLRSSEAYGTINLEEAFSIVRQDLPVREQTNYRVIIEGSPRKLHPIIRDEAYRIGREAVVNAFQHAEASEVEIHLEYSAKYFKVLVRDDGRGIDPSILHNGREGHWGLSGMRERAEKIGAKLKVWSGADKGTEIELSVPSYIAFETNSWNRPLRWLFDFYRNQTEKAGYPKKEQSIKQGADK